MDSYSVKSLSAGTDQDLQEESAKRLAKIEEIKKTVCQEWDNLNDPVPFLQTQGVPVYDMVGSEAS